MSDDIDRLKAAAEATVAEVARLRIELAWETALKERARTMAVELETERNAARAQLATVIQERDHARKRAVDAWRESDLFRQALEAIAARGCQGPVRECHKCTPCIARRALTPAESPPAEMAAVFVGRCPSCDDFPEGPWSSVGEFACQCGAELYASLADGDDGAMHWSFKKAFEDEAAGPTSPTSGTPPHLDNIHMGTCTACGGSGVTPRHKRGLIDDGRCGACTGTGLAPAPGTR